MKEEKNKDSDELMSMEEIERKFKALESDDSTEQNSMAVELINIIDQKDNLFHDQDKEPWIKIQVDGRGELCGINSDTFSDYMSHIAWQRFKKPVPRQTRENVVGIIRGRAKFDSKKYELHTRIAFQRQERVLWYDLGDGRAVKIDKDGWRVIDKPPILFKRFPHQATQAAPIEGGNIESILDFVNYNCKDKEQFKILFLTYMVAVLIEDIPRPILVLHGPQGSAKSCFFRVVKEIIDPSQVDIIAYPRSQSDLVQILSHHFLILFDNLSILRDWESDELCRACTGQSYVKRSLFSNDKDFICKYRKAIGLNGINLVASKPDLLDRSLIFELNAIPDGMRKRESELFEKLESEKPKILGAIFTLLSKAMSIQESIKIDNSDIRFSDYVSWCCAIAIAMGKTQDDFIKAYLINIQKQNEEAIEANSIAQVIIEYMQNTRESSGSVKEIYDRLKSQAALLNMADRDFPKNTYWLWRRMKAVQTNLAKVGIKIERSRDNGSRVIRIINTNIRRDDEK